MERLFFDWHEPDFLGRVAEDLIRRYRTGTRLDMSRVILALSGSHARGRLEAILVNRVERLARREELGFDWYPPLLITVGKLATQLYSLQRPLAGGETQAFVWRAVLKSFSRTRPKELEKLLPDYEAGNLVREIQFGRMLGTLHRELAAEDKDFGDVLNEQNELGIQAEKERWSTLAAMQSEYLALMTATDFCDLQTANRMALRNNACRTDHDLYVIGAVDLNQLQKRMLDAVRDQVHLFILAPESEQARFDEYGCVRPDAWQNTTFPIRDDQLVQTESPADEADCLVDWLFPAELDPANTDQVDRILGETAVCIPNDAQSDLIPFLEERMRSFGVVALSPGGMPMKRNRVFLLLDALANWVGNRTFQAFAELVRHPDFETLILEHWNLGPDPELVPGDWLTELDLWQNWSLAERLDYHWFDRIRNREYTTAAGTPDGEVDDPDSPETEDVVHRTEFYQLRHVAGIVECLLDCFFQFSEEPGKGRSLLKCRTVTTENVDEMAENETVQEDAFGNTDEVAPIRRALLRLRHQYWEVNEKQDSLLHWCVTLSNLLCEIYPLPHEDEDDLKDGESLPLFRDPGGYQATFSRFQIDLGLSNVRAIFDELSQVPEQFLPTTTGATALQLVLESLGHQTVSGIPRKRELPLVGWLDAAMENSSRLSLLAMNEGYVPTSRSEDLFLPDTLRGRLVLEDNRSRLARDAYILTTLTASRKDLRISFQRRTLQGDFLLPSRFLLMGDPQTMAERVVRFFREESQVRRPAVPAPAPVLEDHLYHIPVLQMKGEPPRTMRVTDFARFLVCPYSYFLERQLNIERLRDDATELDARSYGNILHEVLRRFGVNEAVAAGGDQNEINEYLSKELSRVVHGIFDRNTSPALPIQEEQMKRRLLRFSRWQATWRKEGNAILYVEESPRNPVRLDVDGQAVYLRGKIDRIDYNFQTNTWYVFDYKTSEHLETGGATGGEKQVDREHRQNGRWVNLQLPLYRLIVRSILQEHAEELDEVRKTAPIRFGYIALTQNRDTSALMADWSEEEFAEAEEAARDVVRSIRRLWRTGIDPSGLVDPDDPESLAILPEKLPYLIEDYNVLLGKTATR